MNIIFVGNVVPESVFPMISQVSPSSNNVQLAYIHNLHLAYPDSLTVVSCHWGTRALADPAQKKIPEMRFVTAENVDIVTVGFMRSSRLTNISSLFSLWKKLRAVKRKIKAKSDDTTVFIVNNPFYGLSLPAYLAKSKRDKFITIINEGFDVRYLREHKITLRDTLHNAVHRYLLRKNDAFITLNAQTVERYAPGKPYVSLFHACSPEIFPERPVTNSDGTKTVLYAGLFNPCYGLSQIVDAFRMLPDNYRLLLCGGGDDALIKAAEAASRDDSRIRYLGMLPRSAVLALEQQADVLLLIRVANTPSERYIAQYCQPSKLPEYMLSGTPILATDIQGIPDVMKAYLNFTQSDPAAIADNIIRICQAKTSEAQDKAVLAAAFARSHCSVEAQGKEMIRLISEITASR
jgi:glycosyltransferase involved in cell wall biosynthesis